MSLRTGGSRHFQNCLAIGCLLGLLAASGPGVRADVSVDLQPDPPSGQPAGTAIRWTAAGTPPGLYWYRFSVVQGMTCSTPWACQ